MFCFLNQNSMEIVFHLLHNVFAVLKIFSTLRISSTNIPQRQSIYVFTEHFEHTKTIIQNSLPLILFRYLRAIFKVL